MAALRAPQATSRAALRLHREALALSTLPDMQSERAA